MESKDLVLLLMIPLLLVGLIVYTNNAPQITGMATSQQEENNVIGYYSVMPSFNAAINYTGKYNVYDVNGSLVESHTYKDGKLHTSRLKYGLEKEMIYNNNNILVEEKHYNLYNAITSHKYFNENNSMQHRLYQF